MKKLVYAILTVILLSLLSSCSSEKKETAPEMLEVQLSVNPEKGQVNQPITFEAKVTQGKENVEDADDVKFEIWRSKAENHEKIEITHNKNGVYSLQKSFQQEGTYYIISHVTARDMHNMPKKEFTVGTPSEPEDSSSGSTMNGMDMNKK